MSTRVYGLHDNPNHSYPAYAPKVIWHGIRHWLFGPLLGCSCTRCFNSRWRIVPASEIYRDRVRLARLEETVDILERLLPSDKRAALIKERSRRSMGGGHG